MKKIVTMMLVLCLIFGMSGVNTFAVVADESGWTLSDIQLPAPRHAAASCIAEGKLYLLGGASYIGGGSHTATLYAYDFETRTWAQKRSMPHDASHTTAVYLDGKIYVIGGYRNGYGTVGIFWAYDIATDTWASIGNFPAKLCNMSAVAVDGKIYVCGGGFNDIMTGLPTRISSALYVYSLEENTWTQKANMLAPSSIGFSKLAHYNSELYYLGGTDLSAALVPSSCQKYSIAQDRWEKIAEMPIGRCHGGFVSVDSDVYVIGGCSISTIHHNEVQKYSMDTNTWEQLESMPVSIRRNTAEYFNGQIYVLGGHNGVNSLNTVYVYSPATNPPIIPPSTLQLSVLLNAGEKIRLSVSDDKDDNENFVWTTSNASVATVDSKGVVTGVAEGACHIIAKNQALNFEQSIPIRIENGAPDNPKDASINLADTVHRSGVIASSTWFHDAGYEADKAVDGDMGTRWASTDEADNPVMFTIRFNDVYTFNHILLRACTDRINSYELQYLKAGISDEWITFKTGNGVADDQDVILEDFGDLVGKGVRIILHRDALAVSLYELQVRYK